MPGWFPKRPLYRKEFLIVGYPLLFSFLLLFLCRLVGHRFFNTESLGAVLLLELAAFLLPISVFLLIRGKHYLPSLRLRMPKAAHLPLLLCAFFVLLCGCLLLSILCGGTHSLGNSATAYETEAISSPLLGVAMTVVLAILPALLEELLFRGILVAEYERRGGVRAVLMSALLFALIHFDLSNLAVYLFSGTLFALVLFTTNSLPAVMLLHVLYNIVSLFGQRYLNAIYRFTGNVELFLFFVVLLFLVALLFFCRTAARIYREYDSIGLGAPRRDVPWDVQLYTIADALLNPPILLCIGIAIAGFFLL